MAGAFTLKNFAEQCQPDKFYRLDIIRGVSFEKAYDPTMPFQSVIVNFSCYSSEYQSLDKIRSIPAKDIFKSCYIDKTANLAIDVDVTNLIFLKPGTVWINGASMWESTELTNVCINQSEASMVSSYSESKLGTKMPFLYGRKNVQFLKFPNSKVKDKTITVLIPSTEIIRYYFSGSTYFTRELFNGALKSFNNSGEANRLFFKYEFDEADESVYIWLKRNCFDSDAFMIARGLADEVAMNAMSYIYASLVHAKTNFKTKDGDIIPEVCPRTSLPFSGATNLEVLGQWLPRKDGETEFTEYMVRTIEDCDHPLPFKKIRIESVDSYQSSGEVNEDEDPKPSKPRRKRDEDSEPRPPNYTEGERPTDGIAPEELKFMMQRFSHLEDVLVEKVEKVSEKEKQRHYQQEKESNSDDGSTLPGDYRKDNDLQPWNNRAIDSEPIPISERLVTVSNAVATVLEKETGWFAEALPVNCVDDTLPFGLYSFERPTGKNARYDWNMVGERNRRTLFLAISNQSGQTVYLLEIEGKGGVSFSLFLFRADQYEGLDYFGGARSLMFEIADSSGSKIKDGILEDFVVTSMKHTESDNDSFVDRLHRAIDGVFKDDEDA
ncbi:hypothetical protein [Hydrogenovibrio thermophilus]|uniref:TnsE C-terminal domain-containing protein n=1 Tax=Hydrogenovibrio thermophilus TaxID=265883 RepID=A0A451G4M5_9GAMM|nr:hypothetical protein [Hydrogenovibrio thermophilus]QAB14429.1 hypothetical protein EPV75_01445 [Hydrogenovibrio thermophilus]